MKYKVIHWIILSFGTVLAIVSLTQTTVSAATSTDTNEDTPELSTAFNDSPEHQAIVKMLRDRGEDKILQNAYSVAMSEISDFADVIIKYSIQDETAETELYLFKEGDSWVAYPELPTQKDHPAIFTTLARQNCKPRYKDLQGIGFMDDTSENKDPKKRSINIVCSELIDNQWLDHRITFVFEYDDKQGWHITGQSEIKPPPTESAQEERSGSKPEQGKQKAIWKNAKTAIDEIVQFIGGNPEPVFINFGIAGQDFIQFHYVTENGSGNILEVEWNNGNMNKPQTSGLARPCPPIPFGEINFDHVPRIFDDINRKANRGDMLNVNLSRRFDNGCQEPIWQGIVSSGSHLITITYTIDGKQTGTEEYSF